MKIKRPRVPEFLLETVTNSPTVRATTTTMTATTTTGKLLKRKEAAERLGISHTQLRRLELDELPSIVKDGVNYHSEQQILEYKIRQTKTVRGGAAGNGDITAAAFASFDGGMGPVDVAIALKIDSQAATELYQQWANLRGGIFIDGESAARLQNFAHDCNVSLKNGADLIALIEGLDVQDCAACERRTPSFCLPCYERRPQRAEEILAVARAAYEQRSREHAEARVKREAAARAHAIAREASIRDRPSAVGETVAASPLRASNVARQPRDGGPRSTSEPPAAAHGIPDEPTRHGERD